MFRQQKIIFQWRKYRAVKTVGRVINCTRKADIVLVEIRIPDFLKTNLSNLIVTLERPDRSTIYT